MKPIRILLLEDDAGDASLTLREFCEMAKRIAQSEVEVVESVGQLKDCIKTKSYDAAIIDLNVHDSQGISTLRAVLESVDNKFPVLVYTGHVEPDVITEATRLGVADVIPKSTDLKGRLLTALIASMERNHLPRPAEKILTDSAKKLGAG